MRLLLIADLHFKDDRYGLLDLKYEIGTSLLTKTIDKVDYVILAGDTQDKRIGYDSRLATLEAEMYASVGKENQKKIYLLTGNHDSRFRTYHPVSPYAVGANINIVAEEPVLLTDSNGTVVLQGWNGGDKLPVAPNENSYYIGHVNIKDLIGKGVSYEEIESSAYRRVLSGDYHRAFEKGKFVSLGTLFPSNFADKDYEPVFSILDTETDGLKRLTLSRERYPRFIVIKATLPEAFLIRDVGNKIVRLKLESEEQITREQKSEIKSKLLGLGARYVDIKIESKKRKVEKIETEDPFKLLEAQARNWTESQTRWGRRLIKAVIND